MLHNICYIIKPDILQQTVLVENTAVIALEIETSKQENIRRSFQLAEKYITESPFCLFIQLHTPLSHEQATDLTAFLFVSNYYKHGTSPQIIVGGANTALIDEGIEQLQQAAKGQGFLTIQFISAASLPGIFTSTNQTSIRETYRSWLLSPAIATDTLYISIEHPSHLNSIREALEAEEAQFGRQNPVVFALKMQNQRLNEQVQQLELFYKAAQQEITNQVSHNQILRSTSQATALQNYYNNEYEVLPLWFKRIGHIVKTLMGKRSFKSLYSNKVKKYKD